jgi:hypothetical protein
LKVIAKIARKSIEETFAGNNESRVLKLGLELIMECKRIFKLFGNLQWELKGN